MTRNSESPKLLRKELLAGVARLTRLALFLIGLVVLILAVLAWGLPSHSTSSAPPFIPRRPGFFPTATPLPKKVGLVAGHWQFDSGAMCEEGLREVDINLTVAHKTAFLLRQKGYNVEVLAEYAPSLNGYMADAFVALHSDSCTWPASGFKVARVTNSAVPEEEDQLVACLWNEYGTITGLPRHENSITDDMRNYHAFRRIAPTTPGAIIELGFMSGDRDLLVNHQDVVARGVAEAIDCFLSGRKHPTPTP